MKKIYILHGWTYTKNAWATCVLELRNKGIEPVLLSIPGLTEPSDKIWNLDEYVEWFREKVEPESAIILMGHSNGGRIALAYTLKYPSKVSALILEDAAGIFHNEPMLKLRRAVIGSVAKIGKKAVSAPLARKVFYRLIGARDYEVAPKNMRETMKNLTAVDLSPSLKDIHVKTLILWGAKDKATPLSDGNLMHKEIKASKIVVFPDAKHSPHQTHPLRVAEEVAIWLS